MRLQSIRRNIGRLALKSMILLFAILLVGLPMWAMLVNSLKPLREANRLDLTLPKDWSHALDNYTTVFSEAQFVNRLLNNIVILVPAVVIVLFLGSAAAWYFGRRRGTGARIIFGITISAIIVPPAVITTVQLLRGLGVYGTHTGMTIFYIGAYLSFAIFIMTGFVNNIPVELEEASRIDGATRTQTYFRIILPLLTPIFASTGVVILFLMWNDFFYPLFLAGPSKNATLVLGLYDFISGSQHQLSYNLLFAGVIVMSLPMIFLLLLAHKYLVEGLTAGSSK